MDGSPSAPDSTPEPPEFTEGSSRSTDAERELRELRARAYGPEADIESDPTAMARLVELEAARKTTATSAPEHPRGVVAAEAEASESTRAAVSSVDAPPPPPAEAAVEQSAASTRGPRLSLWQRATRRRRRTLPLIAAAAFVVLFIAAGATWLLAPHPDATLQETEFDPNSGIIEMLDAQGRNPESSTFRQFEPYHDVDVWAVEREGERACLIIWDKRSGRYGAKCVPSGREAALFMGVGPDHSDGFGEWLSEPSIVSFHLRANTVDVFVRPRSPAGDEDT